MMMKGCARCGTSWTSLGMPICPICGDRVPDPEPAVDIARPNQRESQDPAPLAAPAAAPVADRKTAVLETEPLPSPGETVILRSVPVLAPLRPVAEERTPEVRTGTGPEAASPPEPRPVPESPPIAAAKPVLVDASCVLGAPPWTPGGGELPLPARPLNGPAILGALAVAGALLPLFTAAAEGNRIFGILGFCLSGFLLPFPPIAWIAGLGAEKRRREQRLRPERRVLVGRMLGQAATLFLVAEASFGLLFVAAMRLSGKFPETFWAK